MPTISKREFAEITYIWRPIVDGKPDPGPQLVRTGIKHRYFFRGAIAEIIQDADDEAICTTLLQFAGQKGVALQRRLKREALKRGKSPDQLEREICLMVAGDVRKGVVFSVREVGR